MMFVTLISYREILVAFQPKSVGKGPKKSLLLVSIDSNLNLQPPVFP